MPLVLLAIPFSFVLQREINYDVIANNKLLELPLKTFSAEIAKFFP